jgi:AcrR family transcriptional regulator
MNRKGAIASASAKLFAEKGFAAVGMDDIGAAVGISGPAIYRHFAGKDAVLAQIINELLEEFAAQADVSSLHELVENWVAIALSHPAEVGTYIRERRQLSSADARMAAECERAIRDAWERTVRLELPTLPRELVDLRQQAVLVAMGTMTLQRGSAARPRLDQRLAEASLRMLRMPPAGPTVGTPQPDPPKWQPEMSRREIILSVALSLFRVKGYHGVGIDEIGDAAGISGPAVYRYYASKSDILLDAYDRVGSRVAVGVEDAISGASNAEDALDRLIQSYVTIAFDNVDLIIATGQEGAAMPASDRPRLQRQRRYIAEGWVRVVVPLRPDLSEPEVRGHVRVVFPLVNHLAQLPPREIDRALEVRALVKAFFAQG